MQTGKLLTSLGRAVARSAAASQRGMRMARTSGGAHEASAAQRALSGAFSRKMEQGAAHRKPPAAVLEAAIPQTEVELAHQVQAQLHRQMTAVEAAAVEAESPSATMQAAAEHLKGIPLRSKREYKALIADWVARRQ